MKRILKLAMAVFAASCMHSAMAVHTFCDSHPDEARCKGTQPNAGILTVGATGPTAPFLPKDTVYASRMDNVGRHCDTEGNYTDSSGFRCKEMLSRSSGLRYRVRQSVSEGYRVFIVTQNGTLQRYADCDPTSKVVYQSDAAQKVAQANGYRLDPGKHHGGDERQPCGDAYA